MPDFNSNNLLVIDPTHQLNEEKCFWSEMAFHAEKQGWNYIQIIAAFNAPPLKHTVYLPKTNESSPMEERCRTETTPLPKWIDDDSIQLIYEWECVARARPQTNVVRRKIRALASWVDCAMIALRPSVVLLASDVLPACALFLRACRYYGVRCCFQERSPCGGIWFEPNGYFSASVLWREWPALSREVAECYRPAGRQEIKILAANPSGFRQVEDKQPFQIELQDKDQKTFLLLLDNVTFSGWHPHGIPSRQINYPLYRTPWQAISHIAALVQNIGGTLIVKRHPACCIFTVKQPENLPQDVIYYDGAIEAPLQQADVIITFISKTAFNALAMGKPVVTLAQNPVAASGSTYHPKTYEEVEQALKDAAANRDLDAKLNLFIPFVGWASEEFFFSYASNPPLYPHLAKACGRCRTQRGPKDLLSHILANLPESVQMPQHELHSHLSYLKYLAGRDEAQTYLSQRQIILISLRVISQCFRRVALYGAGKFTRKLFSMDAIKQVFMREGVSCMVFDDQPEEKDASLFDVHDIRELPAFVEGTDAVVVMATDTWQSNMRTRLHEIGIADSKVVDLFN